MLSKPIQEALEDIFGQVRSNELHPERMDDPEAYLLGLLMKIQEDLHSDGKYRAMLFDAIEQGGYEDQFNDAKKKLGHPMKRTSKESIRRGHEQRNPHRGYGKHGGLSVSVLGQK